MKRENWINDLMFRSLLRCLPNQKNNRDQEQDIAQLKNQNSKTCFAVHKHNLRIIVPYGLWQSTQIRDHKNNL